MSSDEILNKLTEDPKQWEFGHYEATNTKYKLRFWVANGLLGFDLQDGVSPRLGIINSIRLYYWLKSAQRDFIVNKPIERGAGDDYPVIEPQNWK